MASTTVTTRSQVYLVSCAEGIEGSKLPSVQQVFGHFFHCHNVLKRYLTSSKPYYWKSWRLLDACKNTHQASPSFYQKAWTTILSVEGFEEEPETSDRDSASQQSKVFRNGWGIFVIAHVSAMKLIENEVTNCEVLWNSMSSESNDEDVCVSTTSWFVFEHLCQSRLVAPVL